MTPAVTLRDVWQRFIVRHNRADSLKSRVVGLVHERYREHREEFWALRGVTLAVRPGETLGVIGPNGAGKSTLLRLIARTLYPTRGKVQVYGRVAPMIELGIGFHQELTGRENIYLNASLYGLSRRQMDAIYDDVVAFSELGDFTDVPVKNYSTGMYARLGFSIAAHLDPDVLLVDEVLAVGDEPFQRKCLLRMQEFRRRGKTILVVSHSPALVRSHCDRACLLVHGTIAAYGGVEEVLEAYRGAVAV